MAAMASSQDEEEEETEGGADVETMLAALNARRRKHDALEAKRKHSSVNKIEKMSSDVVALHTRKLRPLWAAQLRAQTDYTEGLATKVAKQAASVSKNTEQLSTAKGAIQNIMKELAILQKDRDTAWAQRMRQISAIDKNMRAEEERAIKKMNSELQKRFEEAVRALNDPIDAFRDELLRAAKEETKVRVGWAVEQALQ